MKGSRNSPVQGQVINHYTVVIKVIFGTVVEFTQN
jgi:hypothetical protein